MSNDILLKAPGGESLQLSIYGHDKIFSSNMIFLVHGFKGFKDWGFGPFVGEFFAQNGYTLTTFNFSHNGIDEDPLNFTALDKFADNTFTRELNEIDFLIDSYVEGKLGDIKGGNKIGVIGHSRGGAISLLSASSNRGVDALVTWSAVSSFDRYSERQKKEWKEKGYFEVLNSRTNQMMKLNFNLLKDLEENSTGRLNIRNAAGALNKPWLIVHGEQDLAVNIREAEELYEWSNKSMTRFMPVESTGHTFDIKHPFEGSNKKFDRVTDATLKFFEENFTKS
jgi:pimeloyl-ACP methyl ester carboxylesterase